MSTHSQELDKSFEKYRESASYEKEVENRMEVLSKFQFKPEFMDKLARFSVDTGIKIFELLDPDNRKLLLSENANLEKAFANLDEKQSNLTRRKILDSTEKEKKAA